MNTYTVTSGGRLKITDNREFLRMLSSETMGLEAYRHLEIYGMKQLSNVVDIPLDDKKMIINMAIHKAQADYEGDKSGFLTYYTSKIRGEVTDYRNKRKSMMDKVHMIVSEEASSYKLTGGDGDEVVLDKITEESPETILYAEDIYRRKIQAFRMAFSGIPRYSQYILRRIVEHSDTADGLAAELNIDRGELLRLRNYALSLILARVLRSHHLDEEEKNEVRKEHGLI